uniref:Piwi-like protein 1 n=2 Tax=Lygus hesperus TaxID=30085 RepID=A0A0A9X777_LYGHE
MSSRPNRVGRGEALKRLLGEQNGQNAIPSESTLKPSGGRGQLLSKASLISNGASNGSTYSNGSGTNNGFASNGSGINNGFTRNGFETESKTKPAGAGRAKLFQRLSSDGRNSQASVINGSSRAGLSAHKEDDLASLSLNDEDSERDNSPVICKGTSGQQYTMVTNYFRLETEPGKGIYMYEVLFYPDIDSLNLRKKIMNQLSNVLKETRSFDGRLLYLPFELDQKVTEIPAKSHDGSDVNVVLTLRKKMRMGDVEAVHLYNIIFRRIMNILELILDGGKFTDPKAAQMIPEHKLEVWPGFVTAVQEYEDGVMLMCNSSYRVLQKCTVHDLMTDLMSCSQGDDGWMRTLTNMMVNQTVLTRYNNKSYRIDEVVYNASPMDTFMRQGEPITYYDYYYQHYDIIIKDKGQPLLRGIQKAKIKGREFTECIDLIPELCHLSGITDTMRNDNKVMKAIITYSRISPNQRQQALERFLKRIHSNPEANQLLRNWGLRLAQKNLKLPGRLLHPEPVIFGQDIQYLNEQYECDWNGMATRNPVLSGVALSSWVILCTRRDVTVAKDFLKMCMEVSRRMGIEIQEARVIQLPDDNTQNYVQELRRLRNQQIQLAFILMPIARTDKYSAIKKVCCIDNPLPSQVALTRTLRNPGKLRSVTQKIVLQMNCKLGGTLWQVKVPLKNTMVIGLHTYHDPSRKSNSVGAVVASMNQSLTRWYSTIYRQSEGTELISGLETAVQRCLNNYFEVTGTYPNQLIIFRDGLGDGQLETCKEFEVKQIVRACMKVDLDYKPNRLFVVVQKRIQTRLFFENKDGLINPPPGSIMDHSITRRDKFDFFLVSKTFDRGL